jgi:hypothetical protein
MQRDVNKKRTTGGNFNCIRKKLKEYKITTFEAARRPDFEICRHEIGICHA